MALKVWHAAGARNETTESISKDENEKKVTAKKRVKKTEKELKEIWKEIRHNVYKFTGESNITKPIMVFSVIGDADSFVPRPWKTISFQMALIEAAKSAGESWILYGRKKKGVSIAVENAYEHYEKIEFLRQSADKNDPKRHIKLINVSEEIDIPDGDEEDDNLELDFERFVSKQKVFLFGRHIKFKIPIPVAIIVCEGDLVTIAQTSYALKNSLPVIIMKGSGKAADLTIDYLESPEVLWKRAPILFGITLDDTSYYELEKYLKEIKEHKDLVTVFDVDKEDPLLFSNIVGDALVKCMLMTKTFKKNKKEAIHENDEKTETESESPVSNLSCNNSASASEKQNVEKTENKPESTVSNLSCKNSASVSVNKNVEKTEKGQKSTASKLSFRNFALVLDGLKDHSTIQKCFAKKLYWIPKTYVSRAEYCTATSLPLHFYFGYQMLQVNKLVEEIGHILLFEALKANRCDYVKVLLDRNVVLNDHYLNELYLQTVLCTECGVQSLNCSHIKWDLKKIPQAQMLYAKLEKMFDDRTNQRTKNHQEDHNQSIMKNTAKQMCLDILRYDKFENFWREFHDDYSAAGILLWAIFLNRKDLAEICWRNVNSKFRLLAGLICLGILEKLSKNAKDVKEHVISKNLEDHSRMFEERCISLMDKMSEENEPIAITSLIRTDNIWGIRSNPLTFAYENFMYDIIAHPCSQKYMNNQWSTIQDPDMNSFFKSTIWNHFRTSIQAPKTKYAINYIVFFLVLIAYSIFVLTSVGTKYRTPFTTALEIFVYIWNVGDALEEIVACTGCMNEHESSYRGVLSRIERHLNDFWNVVDLLSYLLIIVAICVRYFYQDESLTLARNSYALSLLVMYLRFLEVFLVHQKLGPTLMMIKEMLKDLLVFLLIAFFVILGVGIYYHANLWPDHQAMWNNGFSNWGIWKIIYYPYWQLYGEFNLDVLYGDDHSECNVTSIWESDMSTNRCPHEDWTVPFIAGVFVLFSNLLLVNLVIAMFSYTFERVMKIAEKLSHFQRYTVIIDYKDRIPSPFNLILRPIIWICSPEKCCMCRCSCKVHNITPKQTEKGK